MPTHRQNIIELLSQGIYTLQELSSEAHLSMKELPAHLEHVRRSVQPPNRFVVEPAKCLACGFVFKDRKKFHSPGKCPKCRSSHISEPAFGIIK